MMTRTFIPLASYKEVIGLKEECEFVKKFVDSTPLHEENERESRLFSTIYMKFGLNDNNVQNIATIKVSIYLLNVCYH